MMSIKDLAKVTDPAVARAAGMIRRMVITLSGAKAIWQLTGFRQLDGSNEVVNAEVFSGVGFYARPAASGKPEAIVVMVGDGKVPAVVAVRDEATRAAVAGDLEADETAVFTSQAIVHLKNDGTVEIRSEGGAAVPLATKADLDALRAAIQGAVPVANDGGAALKAAILAAAWTTGTAKLKGE